MFGWTIGRRALTGANRCFASILLLSLGHYSSAFAQQETQCRLIELTENGKPVSMTGCHLTDDPLEWQRFVSSVSTGQLHQLSNSNLQILDLVSEKLRVPTSFIHETIQDNYTEFSDLSVAERGLQSAALSFINFNLHENQVEFGESIDGSLPGNLDERVKRRILQLVNQANRAESVQEAESAILQLRRLAEATQELDDGFVRIIAERYAAKLKVEKTIYETYDNFPAWSYREIHQHANNTIAIARNHNGEPFIDCSGVYIFDDLVLTAAHCFKVHPPSNYHVYLNTRSTKDRPKVSDDYAKHAIIQAHLADGTELPLDGLAPASYAKGTEDFVLLEIDTKDVDGKPASRRLPSACLYERAGKLNRDDKLYVIGFPRRSQTAVVHDDSRVHLPFELHSNTMEVIQVEIEAEAAEEVRKLINSEVIGAAEADDQFKKIRDSKLKAFKLSYVEKAGSNPAAWEFYDATIGGQPKIGIVADTFGGDSGAPVFSRDHHCIAGIFIGGNQDIGRRLTPSWSFHESMIPMNVILQRINDHYPEGPNLIANKLAIK